ncbi:MAG: tetratricopeptide repeat protein [Candidatus Cloacimonetes bacterium]|jgi:tetratricopeptide (TPR) repeat protein
MKRIFLLTLVALLFLTGCATTRHKLSPQANVDLKTANVYYSQQNVEEALKYYNRVLQDNPDHAIALRRVADIYLYYGEQNPEKAVEYNKMAYEYYDKAISIMEKYEKPKEDELAAIRDMKKRKASAWTRVYNKGIEEMNAGNTQQAIKIFEQSAEMDTTEMKPLNMLVNIYQNELKDMEKAGEILFKLYQRNPEDIEVMMNLGVYYYNKQEYENAIPLFEKVKDKDPTNIKNLLVLTDCYYATEQYDKANNTIQLVLIIEPRNPDALATAYDIAVKLNDNEAALNYLKQLLDIKEDNIYYENIVILLNSMERWDELADYAQKWHKYDETNKMPVQFVIYAAQKLNNKALEKEYTNILKQIQ